MGWSLKIGRLAGIDIFVHFTFLILLGWIAVGSFVATGDAVAGLSALLLTAAVFAIIVLHELGHALAARYYGIPTRDITLLPIGGVARLERMPDKPVQELVVALAGPAVNVVLAGVFFALMVVQGIAAPELSLSFTGNLIEQLFLINVGLAAFNMLPAFPMDGGRVLRALLAMPLGRSRATQIAAVVGRVMAGAFVAAGLLSGNLMLVLAALFVWVGAGEEAAATRSRAGLAGLPASAVMVRDFATLSPDDRLDSIARFVLGGFQRDFPVVVGSRVVGMLTRSDLRHGLDELPANARVTQVMQRDFPTVGPDDPPERWVNHLSSHAAIPVVEHGELVGLLTPDAFTHFVWHQRGRG
jgi:Zn-dependent protease/CBS domain-containing protein